ncbi:MAG: Calx-beta domain-containing protein [Chloroflexota bacterium]
MHNNKSPFRKKIAYLWLMPLIIAILFTLITLTPTSFAGPSVAPNLDDFGPAANDTDVSVSANITATFDSAIDTGTVLPTSFAVHSEFYGLITDGLSATSTEITVNPAADFRMGDHVQVIATSNISNTTNEAIANPQQWGFVTGRTVNRCFDTFADSGTADDALTGVYAGSGRWLDTNGDGHLDIVIMGQTGSGLATQIAINSGAGTFSDGGAVDAALSAAQDGSIAVGDFDNDGDPDLLLTGKGDGFNPLVQIGRNNAGTFADSVTADANLPIISESGADWGDYDNDGDLDLLLSGQTNSGAISKIFRNDNGVLVDSGDDDLALPVVNESAVAWGDYDNDGDLDLVISGNSTSGVVTQIFKNDGGVLNDSGDTDDNITAVRNGAVAWGDINNDGYLDLAISGRSAAGSITHIYEYDSVEDEFVNNGDVLTGVQESDLAFGDIDNDGDLDLAIVGSSNGGNTAEIYENDGGNFTRNTRADANLTGVTDGSVALADHDADGDVDLLITGDSNVGAVSKLFTNENCSVSIAAPAPSLEGDSGNTTMNFTVSRSGDEDTAVTVNYAVTGGGDTTTADFGGAFPSGTVNILAGQASATLPINVSGDSSFEADEDYTVTISNPTAEADLGTSVANGTITNDDSQIHITPLAADNVEGDSGTTPFTFTITRTGYLAAEVDVDWAVTGSSGDPADADDFQGATLPSGNYQFGVGQDNLTLTVNVNGDKTVEEDEGFTVTLNNPSAGGDISTATATGTIENDDGDLNIFVLDANKAEGDSGTISFTFTVTKSAAFNDSTMVNYTVAPAGVYPADADDFGGAFPTGIVSFTAVETSKTVTINVSGDHDFEDDEEFSVTLSGATNDAVIAIASANGTIQNDDTGLSISADSGAQPEGTDITFLVTRSGDTSGTNDVSYSVTGNGTYPANAADFGGAFPTGAVSFAIGEETQLITLTVATDADVEANETFSITLSSPTNNANILVSEAAGTIENDDGTVSISPDGLSQVEGNSGTVTYTYSVSLSSSAIAPVSVNYAVSGSGANPADSTDFGGSLPSGMLSFGVGEDTKTLEIAVSGDDTTESDETFDVTLSSMTGGYSIATGDVTSTIENDDRSISISTLSAVKNEGQSGITPFTFLISRSGETSGAITADYVVVPNSATSEDFAGGIVPSGTLTLPDGTITTTLTVNVTGDTSVEPSETFDVEISNASGATIQTSRATGIIQNDDNGFSIAAVTPSQAEGNGGNTIFAFEVTRNGTSTTNSSISYEVSGIGANPADETDFGGFFDSGILPFQSGLTDQSITISVSVVGDSQIEGDETFVVTLSNPTNGEEISTASAVATIENDDEGLNISALPGDQAQDEGDSGTTNFSYTVELVGSYPSGVTVDYAVTGSGARPANSTDFVGGLPSGTITFISGDSQQTLEIPVQGDTSLETDEEFTITLSNVTGGAPLGVSSITGTIQNDDPSDPGIIYLPLIAIPEPPYPDLVVESISVTGGVPTIVIRNSGRAAATADFWVDLYVNPATPPTQVNETIDTLQSDGMVWGIESSLLPLEPDDTLTLTPSSSSFSSGNISSIPAGATVYVQVDSANFNTNYGGVLESHEIYGRPYNNISSITNN